jgi:hypothetical protein
LIPAYRRYGLVESAARKSAVIYELWDTVTTNMVGFL